MCMGVGIGIGIGIRRSKGLPYGGIIWRVECQCQSDRGRGVCVYGVPRDIDRLGRMVGDGWDV